MAKKTSEPDPKAVSYLKQLLQTGTSPAKAKKQAEENGWTHREISHALTRAIRELHVEEKEKEISKMSQEEAVESKPTETTVQDPIGEPQRFVINFWALAFAIILGLIAAVGVAVYYFGWKF